MSIEYALFLLLEDFLIKKINSAIRNQSRSLWMSQWYRYHKPLIPFFFGGGALLCVRAILGIVGVTETNDTVSLPHGVDWLGLWASGWLCDCALWVDFGSTQTICINTEQTGLCAAWSLSLVSSVFIPGDSRLVLKKLSHGWRKLGRVFGLPLHMCR